MPIPTHTGADLLEAHLSWNVVRDIEQVLEYRFMLNAMLAGAVVAVMAGTVGWMMVLRRETFAGHTLSMMAFPGASLAALIGVAAPWGYFAFCGAGAIAIGASAPERRTWGEQAAGIGVFQAVALAAGFLFVSLYGGVLGDLENLLFGDLLGVTDGQVLELALVALATLVLLAALARPLLFASVDPDVAKARGVPVRGLSITFLAMLGAAVAATSQITGPLLVFALLVMPAASAQAITARPALSLLLTILIGLFITWLGLAISYFSAYPAGFFIATIAFVVYLLARLLGAFRAQTLQTQPPAPEPVPRGVIA